MASAKDQSPASVANPDGPFHPGVPPAEPLTTKGHQPGRKFSPADYAPEGGVQPLPPGTAPPDKTFLPNPIDEVPGQALNPAVLDNPDPDPDVPYTSASDTLIGADSRDLDKGLGKPAQGMSSAERHHDGQNKRKKERNNIHGRGAGWAQGAQNDMEIVAGDDPNPDVARRQRALNKEDAIIPNPKAGHPSAEERPPVDPEHAAVEVEKKSHPEHSAHEAKKE